MAYTPVPMFRGQLPAAETTLFSGSGTGAILREVVVCNVSAASQAFGLSVVPSGGTAGVTNRVLFNVSVAAGQTMFFTFSQVLAAGDFLSGLASNAASLNMSVSGVTL